MVKFVAALPPDWDLGRFPTLQLAYVSSKTGLNLTVVREQLKEAVRDCVSHWPLVRIGKGRAEVRNRLRQILASGRRLMERQEFDELCGTVGGVDSTGALLDFLHHNGVVFYKPGLFEGRIILDQNWALRNYFPSARRRNALCFGPRAGGRTGCKRRDAIRLSPRRPIARVSLSNRTRSRRRACLLEVF